MGARISGTLAVVWGTAGVALGAIGFGGDLAAFGAGAGCEGELLPVGALAEALAWVVVAALALVRPAGARAAVVFTVLAGARGVPPTGRRSRASADLTLGSDFFDLAEVARLALGTCMAVLWGSWSGLDRGSGIDCAPQIVNPLAHSTFRMWRGWDAPFQFCRVRWPGTR